MTLIVDEIALLITLCWKVSLEMIELFYFKWSLSGLMNSLFLMKSQNLFKWFRGWIFRSSHWRCSIKKGVHTNFAVFTGRHLCWSLFLKKLHFWNFIKTRLQHKCSSVNLVKFLGTPILKNTCKRLLLNIQIIKISWTVYTIVGD